jgi:hypothetical protein
MKICVFEFLENVTVIRDLKKLNSHILFNQFHSSFEYFFKTNVSQDGLIVCMREKCKNF